jgi:hypothetical protein
MYNKSYVKLKWGTVFWDTLYKALAKYEVFMKVLYTYSAVTRKYTYTMVQNYISTKTEIKKCFAQRRAQQDDDNGI